MAGSLLEALLSYEAELIALERETPACGALRRAVRVAITEACYCITDQKRAAGAGGG